MEKRLHKLPPNLIEGKTAIFKRLGGYMDINKLQSLSTNELVKKVRSNLKMNQTEFGKLIGYKTGAQVRVSEIERGIKTPGDAVRKLCLIIAEHGNKFLEIN